MPNRSQLCSPHQRRATYECFKVPGILLQVFVYCCSIRTSLAGPAEATTPCCRAPLFAFIPTPSCMILHHPRYPGISSCIPHAHSYVDATPPPPQVFPFVHTFPACDESRRTWIESTCSRCPTTSALLRRVPNIRTALFSRLGGGSRISGHRGWADLANHVLRCHLPLKVPSDGPCGLWVNEEVCVCVVVLCSRVFVSFRTHA